MAVSTRLAKGTGATLSAVVAVFLFADAIMKLLRLEVVISTMRDLGWPESAVVPLGLLLLACTLLYALPRTSVLGAVLLTGYLGAAVATHARIGSPLFTHTFFGVYVGALMWAGLFLRDPALREIFPARR